MKRSDSVLWQKPLHQQKCQKGNTNNATKKFDYTTVADRLRTVSWSSYGHPTVVVNLFTGPTKYYIPIPGRCRADPLTVTGKRIQMAKMLTLVVLPVLGLWGYSVSLLTEVIADKYDNEKVSVPVENLYNYKQVKMSKTKTLRYNFKTYKKKI